MVEYRCRAARPSDQAYVASTWTMSMYRSNHRGRRNRAAQASVVDRVLDRPDTRIVVACDKTDENHIVGWLAYAIVGDAHLFVLLYAFVRLEARRKGVARALAEHAGLPASDLVVYTFEGPMTKALKTTALLDVQRIEPSKYMETT